MENKLAIVIPYYKIDFFEETIQSLSVQTDNRFTLYIGNDASPNNPLPTINKHLKEGEYLYFDYKDNVGGTNLALQWERILENVTEDWFMILGDDDRVSPNFVEEFYKHENDYTDINLIKARNTIVKEGDIIMYDFTGTLQAKQHSSIDFFLQKMQGKMNSSLSEHIFRKKAFKGFRKYPLAWHDDDWALLNITECGNFYFLKDTHVLIREYAGSISGNEDNLDKKNEATDLFFNDTLRIFNHNKISIENKNTFLAHYQRRFPFSKKYHTYINLYGEFVGIYKLISLYTNNYLRKLKS